MPATKKSNIGELWKSTTLITDVPYIEAIDTDNLNTDDEDDDVISPPNNTSASTAAEGSGFASDGTGYSIEEIQTDSSEELIPIYLFQLSSTTRVINVEFNQLFEINSSPTTSSLKDIFLECKVKSSRSSSSDSLTPPSIKLKNKRVSLHIEEMEEDKSISTDIEVKTEFSSDKTHSSLSLDSTETDEIIPTFLYRLLEDKVDSPEVELCLDFEEDSKATDNDIISERSSGSESALFYDKEHIATKTAQLEVKTENESTRPEVKKLTENEIANPHESQTDSSSISSRSMNLLTYEDDEFIPAFLFADATQ